MNSNGDLVHIKDAARMLGLAVSTLYGWARDRRITYVRLGDRLLFDPADLQAFVERQRVPGDDGSQHPARLYR
jgi:excisionase family DNA binding protein